MIVLDSKLFCSHVKALTATVFPQMGKASSCVFFVAGTRSLVMFATDGVTANKAVIGFSGEAEPTTKAIDAEWLQVVCKHLQKGEPCSIDFSDDHFVKIKSGALEFAKPYVIINPPTFSDIFKE